MRKLIEGFRQFQRDYYSCHEHLFQQLARGQQPVALFITCSDSRIDPCLLTGTEPGELFMIRNAGNLVPRYNDLSGSEAATIEYAIRVLKIREIIVCGHSHCGAMGGLLHPEQLAELPAVKAWLEHAKPPGRPVDDAWSQLSDEEDRMNAAVRQNVLVQLENLRTHPCVAEACERGELTLYGWIYQFECGKVYAYNPQQGVFLPLEKGTARDSETAGQ